MLRRIGRKVIICSALMLAYGVYGINLVQRTPIWALISLMFFFSTTASFAKFEPFIWDKTALQLFQAPQTYIQTMRTANMFGDLDAAEQLYLHTFLLGKQTYTSIQLRNAAFPKEKLELLRTFWTGILAKQPSSREAYAALTAIHQSLHETQAHASTLETWMFIEPNDPRLAGVIPNTK